MAKDINKALIEQLEIKMDGLPWYVIEYIQGKRMNSSPRTLLEYVYDYQIFFKWLQSDGFVTGEIKDTPLTALERLRITDVVNFQVYLKHNRTYQHSTGNAKSTINRKMSSLKSLFYYLSNIAEDENFLPYLQRNVMAKIGLEKDKTTAKARADNIKGKLLRGDQINEFREFVITGFPKKFADNKRILLWHGRNKERDLAIISLILGSGLRVKEIEGLNIDDINLIDCTISVIRKGDKNDVVEFSDQARLDLEEYLRLRATKYKVDESFKPLFVSGEVGRRGTGRMTRRAIQEMVVKYSKAYGKPLSIHKLRHSFATKHYEENGDLLVLQRQLGHESANTTDLYTHVADSTLKDAVNRADK